MGRVAAVTFLTEPKRRLESPAAASPPRPGQRQQRGAPVRAAPTRPLQPGLSLASSRRRLSAPGAQTGHGSAPTLRAASPAAAAARFERHPPGPARRQQPQPVPLAPAERPGPGPAAPVRLQQRRGAPAERGRIRGEARSGARARPDGALTGRPPHGRAAGEADCPSRRAGPSAAVTKPGGFVTTCGSCPMSAAAPRHVPAFI